jgi:hypothetical protein
VKLPATCWLVPLIWLPGVAWVGERVYRRIAAQKFFGAWSEGLDQAREIGLRPVALLDLICVESFKNGTQIGVRVSILELGLSLQDRQEDEYRHRKKAFSN